MPSEREMKVQQEDRLFDILLLKKFAKDGKERNHDEYLDTMAERAQSGMNAEEIDAVRERVSRAFDSYK